MKTLTVFALIICLAATCSAYVVRPNKGALSPTSNPKDNPIICNQTGALTQTEIDTLVNKVKKADFTSDKIDVLTDFLANTSKGFTGPEVAQVVPLFEFSSTCIQALQLMDKYIFDLTCKEVAGILDTFSFSSDKLEVLKQLSKMILDLANNATILDEFSFTSDKEEAAKILANAVPRNCVYGTVTADRVIFLVDVSASMSATFTTNNGQQWTRLSFVQYELDQVIRLQLQPSQRFNVYSFAGDVVQWQPGLVPATQENIDSAVNFVGKMNFKSGGTNSYGALQTAFNDPDVVAIYFLTDGEPTAGTVTDPSKIVDAVKSWESKKSSPIPVYATAFLAGYYQGDDKPKARAFMYDLATATGGVYRDIEG